MAKQKVSAIRIQIVVLDENNQPIEKRGAKFDLVNPAKYGNHEVVDAISGAAYRTVEYILKEGVN